MKTDIEIISQAPDRAGRTFATFGAVLRRTVLVGGLLWASFAGAAEPGSRVFLAGDSTMSDKPVSPPNPERGWGQLLPLYLREPDRVVNHAQNGRSTKSFIDEGRWQKLVEALRPGDWVIIQFGHNDEKEKSPERFADPLVAYPDNLRRMIHDVRAAGARPVLATPIVRRRFDPDGKLTDTHGDYPAAMQKVAAEEKVPLLELHELSRKLVAAYGAEASKQLYLHIAPGQYDSLPEGKADDTHLSAVGASRMAELATAEFRRLKLPLVDLLK